jgi:succinate dehydrogenase flavin-adding protein (antitoxin of CptAB toxin-antitoxin module)
VEENMKEEGEQEEREKMRWESRRRMEENEKVKEE